jgi:hypothetical protein
VTGPTYQWPTPAHGRVSRTAHAHMGAAMPRWLGVCPYAAATTFLGREDLPQHQPPPATDVLRHDHSNLCLSSPPPQQAKN